MKAFELTRFEMDEVIKRGAIAIVPIGSCEQHGPHLPLGTDTYLAEFLSEKLASKIDAVIFPSVNFGYSWVWTGMPGTITLSQKVFKELLMEIGDSLVTMGFKRILFVNGHDSNKMAIKYVLRDLKDKYGEDLFLNIFYPNMSKIYSQYMESDTWGGMFHADEFETSLMLAYNEKLVDMDKACKEYPTRPKYYGLDSSTLVDVSTSGVFGDATLATKEKGEKMMDAFVEYILSVL